MGEESKIEWTDHTFNPWIGCTKVSPGCANCYAATQDAFRSWTPEGWGKGKPRKRTSEANWKLPLKWNREAGGVLQSFQQIKTSDGSIHRGTIMEMAALEIPMEDIIEAGPARPRVFCASLADWLDDEVPIEWLADLLDLIRQTPNLDWLLLTKRPENWKPRMEAALAFYADSIESVLTDDEADFINWLSAWLRNDGGDPIPENIWIGTTVEDQKRAEERIPELDAIPARVRFLSCEPLLGPVNLSMRKDRMEMPDSIHWVITGGESGPGCRPFNPDWARSLRDQCQSANVAFFMKQMGGTRKPFPEIPADLMIREFPTPTEP